MKRLIRIVGIVGSCLLIAACGNGSNDKDDNSDNGGSVTGGPVNGSPVDGSPIDGSPVDDDAGVITVDNASFVASEVLPLLGEASDTGSVVEEAVFLVDDKLALQTELVCTNANAGGSVTTTVTDADNNSLLSAGDSVLIRYQNCDEAEDPDEEPDQSIINGSLSLELSEVTRDSANEIIGFQVRSTFSNLSITDPGSGEASTIDGDIALEWIDNGVTLQTKETGQSLQLTWTGEGPGTETLQNYTINLTENEGVNTFSTDDATGVLDSTFIGFPVSFDILQPLQRIGDANPNSGVIVITEANGSKVRVTAIDNINVQLEVDEDADNIYESTNTLPWEELYQGAFHRIQ